MPETLRGYTVDDLASRYRVSPDKVRLWIKRGYLKGINTSDVMCARPRYIVLPESLAEFETARAVAEPPKPKPPRRKRQSQAIDFFPLPNPRSVQTTQHAPDFGGAQHVRE